jgi:LysW-gamma-L-lysine carboxypeptidase
MAGDRQPRPAGADAHRAAELQTLRQLVRIPSPTGSEERAASYLADRMAELGYAARIDDAGNVIGEAGDEAAPVIMMVGHVDTVPGVIAVREASGRLFGRGTVDAKGSLAAMVHAGARAARTAIPARLVVVGAVDEENMSRGANHLLESIRRPDALLIGEPSGVDAVVVGYKGVLRFDYQVHRAPAHSSSPEAGAVEVAADLWQAVVARLRSQYPAGPMFSRALPALIAVNGGAEDACASISCRLPAGFRTDAFVEWVRGYAEGANVTVIENVPSVRTSRADPLVAAMCEAVRGRLAQATIKVKLGTCDMNILSPGWHVPAVAYGPGDSQLDHTSAEHIDLGDYLLAIDVLADALPAIARRLATRVHVPGGRR